MSGRTSVRSLAGRDQASSPPKKQSQRGKKGQIPTARTRTTRSQSLDLDDDSNVRMRKTARLRGVREGSADSAASNESKGRSRRKNTCAAPIKGLPIVAEEEEREQVERDPAAVTELSRLSGTTAQSAQKLDDLDVSILVELIPDLSRDAFRLVELLIPSTVSADTVMAIVNELQVPGSGRGKRLRLREKTFHSTTENYGNESFIDPPLILQKLFNNQDPGPGQFRPEVVLYAANVATLMKELLVAQRENTNTVELLQRLDGAFPTYFLSGFENEPNFGTSALLQASFDLALDLRTQTMIAILNAYRHDINFEPDQILAQLFYEIPEHDDSSVSTPEDLILNGHLRSIAGISAEVSPLNDDEGFDSQFARIRERAKTVREYFYLNKEDIADGDYVDFDELNGRFPWRNFLANVVSWSQLRLAEIRKGIEAQGGVETITNLLLEQVGGSDERVEPSAYPPGEALKPQTRKSTAGLLPAVTIIPASAGKSLYKNSSKVVQDLVKNYVPNASPLLSDQEHPGAPLQGKVSTVSTAQVRPSSPGKPTWNDPVAEEEWIPNLEEEQIHSIDSHPSESTVSSIEEVRNIHDIGERYNIKENQPINERGDSNVAKLKFIDRQLNAKRVEWSQQSTDDNSGHQATGDDQEYHLRLDDDDDDDDDSDEDETAFQNDNRPVDTSRRGKAVAPAVQTRSPTPPTQSQPKRSFNMLQEESGDRTRPAAIAHSPKKRRRLQERELESNEESDDDAVEKRASRARAGTEYEPSGSYLSIAETAKAFAASSRRSVQEPQRRTAWSETETNLLLDLIARWGSKWKEIERAGQDVFSETGRGQVALRDKARNMKVNYLLCGGELPINFDTISLGKKEKDRVKASGINPYRLEDERVGYESHDMDGNKIR